MLCHLLDIKIELITVYFVPLRTLPRKASYAFYMDLVMAGVVLLARVFYQRLIFPCSYAGYQQIQYWLKVLQSHYWQGLRESPCLSIRHHLGGYRLRHNILQKFTKIQIEHT